MNKAVSMLTSLKSGGGDINKCIIAAQVRGVTNKMCTRYHRSPEAWPPRKAGLRHRGWRSELLGSALLKSHPNFCPEWEKGQQGRMWLVWTALIMFLPMYAEAVKACTTPLSSLCTELFNTETSGKLATS